MNPLDPVSRPRAGRAGLLILCAVLSACSSSTPAPSARAPELLGDFTPVVSVKELMKYTIDPLADNIFDAVETRVTSDGVVEKEPKTDEDWDKIRIGAVSLAEGAYLLKVRRPFAPPGDLNNSTGPNAVELSPAEIAAKVERDPVEWNARIETLRNASLAVLDIVRKKDAAALWDAGEILDTACENCHKSYWYPREDAAFYEKLRHRLEDFKRQSPPDHKPEPPQK
jgi:hypothetical protein